MISLLIIFTAPDAGHNIAATINKAASLAHTKIQITCVYWANETKLDVEKFFLYDVILFESINYSCPNADEIGNLFANFVDAGKGLVLTVFSNQQNSTQRVAGRFETEKYHPMKYEFYVSGTNLKLGATCLGKRHELIHNVTRLNGGSNSTFLKANVDDSGVLVAQWDNDLPLVAYKQKQSSKGMVVWVNLFAVNSIFASFSWPSENSDAHWLFFNAVMFAAGKMQSKWKLDWRVANRYQDVQIVIS